MLSSSLHKLKIVSYIRILLQHGAHGRFLYASKICFISYPANILGLNECIKLGVLGDGFFKNLFHPCGYLHGKAKWVMFFDLK